MVRQKDNWEAELDERRKQERLTQIRDEVEREYGYPLTQSFVNYVYGDQTPSADLDSRRENFVCNVETLMSSLNSADRKKGIKALLEATELISKRIFEEQHW